MADIDVKDLQTTEDREEWVLSILAEKDIPLNKFFEVVKMQVEDDALEVADGWFDLLIDELAGRDDRATAMLALNVRVKLFDDNEKFRSSCKEYAERIFSDRVGKVFVENCGFEEKLPLKECLRRLEILSKLKPDCLCYEKTWGSGTVQRVDDFYKKITINFAKKKGHQMSFAYAAESLILLYDDHLFAMQHKEPEALQALINDNPAEVVKIALRSLGEMSAEGVQDCMLENGILKDDEWKGFWEKARKGLKSDPLVDVPAKRSDSICLLDSEKQYDDKWFASFFKELDVDRLLLMMEELIAETDISSLDDNRRDTVLNRVNFAIKADNPSQPGRLAQTMLLAETFGLTDADIGRSEVLDVFLKPKTYIEASAKIPARYLQRFVQTLADYDESKFIDLLLGELSAMPLAVLNSAMDFLITRGRKDDVVDKLKSAFSSRNVAPVLLLWLVKRDDILSEDEVLSYYNLLIQMLATYDSSFTGAELKMRNQLGTLLEQSQWLGNMLGQLTGQEREDILKRIKSQNCWEVSAKRSVMGKIIKMYPELADVVASGTGKSDSSSVRGRYTSPRSYREKQDQLKKIVDVGIPANSKDIGIARSYGDLRENAEYETAKQNQSILMKRKNELAQDLIAVQPTDFAAMPVDKAGMGTCVKLSGPGGEQKAFNILGEWDSDEQLSIISSRSKLAEILTGHIAGDELDLPSAKGNEKYRIVEVSDVSPDVKEWMKVQ